MGWCSWASVLHCPYTTPCSICCIYIRPYEKVNLPNKSHPQISDLFSPLENVIRRKFLISLTGQNAFNNITRELMALPVRLAGLGITNPCANTPLHHDASLKITAPLTALIMEQSNQYSNTTKIEQIWFKKEVVKARKHCQQQAATELKDKLPNSMQRAMSLSTENLREFKLAVHATNCRIQLCIAQECFSWCSLPQIWLASFKFASSVYLWQTVLSGACSKLFPWWFSIYPP